MKKADVYKAYGIDYKAGKIYSSEFGWINPILVNGNSKLGKGVFTWSMLPGTGIVSFEANGTAYEVKGTCLCDCIGCYAKTGFYNMPSVLKANAMKTWIARNDIDFMRRAILAQIEAEGIRLCRIHAAGDFFSAEYIEAWRDIVAKSENCVFWSYTKNAIAERSFDDLENCNIVRSIVPGYGFNFGPCGYILRVYNALKAEGKAVYICRCGIDKNQHCVNCTGCSKNEVVLFIEHSTAYKAEEDPLFPVLRDIIEAQKAE